MRALLDINILIALFDPDHVFHERAHAWWARNSTAGWASCPLTENGLIRIMSNPKYSRVIQFGPSDIISRLTRFVTDTDHEFWADDISLRHEAVFKMDRLHSSSSLTDIYLLGLAARHHGRLATFDQAIPLTAVHAATAENLCAV